jgi:hypothetical protein
MPISSSYGIVSKAVSLAAITSVISDPAPRPVLSSAPCDAVVGGGERRQEPVVGSEDPVRGEHTSAGLKTHSHRAHASAQDNVSLAAVQA